MATTDIAQSVKDITGISSLSTYSIEDAQRFVVSSIPSELMLWAITETSPATHGGNNSNQQITLPQKADSVIFVRRDQFEARQVSPEMRGFIGNSSSLHKATNIFPKYYIADGNRVIIKPDPDNTYTGHAQYIDYSKVDDESDLREAVVFRASSHEFDKLASGKIIDWTDLLLPAAPSSPDFGSGLTISVTAPVAPETPNFTYTDASVDDIVKPIVGISDKALLTTSAPGYIKPVFSAPSLGSVGALTLPNIPVVPPSPSFTYTEASVDDIVTPIINIGDMASATGTPTYSPPVLIITSFPDLTWTFPDTPTSPIIVDNSVSFTADVPTFTPPVMHPPDYTDTNSWISTEEDSEMLSARVQEINVKVGEYSAKMNESQAKFNQENAEYQAQLQVSIQNAQLSAGDDNQRVQKFSAELNDYNSQVNKVINGNNAQINEWQSENNINIQKYANDVNNNLNVFNASNVEYQQDINKKTQNFQKEVQQAIQNAQHEFAVRKAGLDKDVQLGLQNALQNFQADVQEYASKIQKYGAENQSYQAEVNAIIQKWTAEEWTQNFQKYQTDYGSLLQTYQADIQNELNNFNKEQIVYQEDVARKTENFQKEIQQALKNVDIDLQIKSTNLGKDVQIALQNAMSNYKEDVDEYSSKLQKYNTEVNVYQQDMNKEVQDFVNTLQKESQEYQNKVALFGAELQKYQSQVGEKTAKIGSATQNAAYYSAESKKYYEWSVNCIKMYIQNNSKMINRTMAAQQQAAQQQRR